MAESFKILKEAGGELPGREVVARLRARISFNERELEVSPKTGYLRWEAIFSFYTVDSVKAGFLRKNKGTWYLTAEGEKALTLGPVKLFETASAAYRKWEQENKPTKPGPATIAVETLDLFPNSIFEDARRGYDNR